MFAFLFKYLKSRTLIPLSHEQSMTAVSDSQSLDEIKPFRPSVPINLVFSHLAYNLREFELMCLKETDEDATANMKIQKTLGVHKCLRLQETASDDTLLYSFRAAVFRITSRLDAHL